MNQSGFSSLVLLAVIVLSVFVIWEANESINMFSAPLPQPSSSPTAGKTFCPTGEEGNCNDSNDVFLFSE